MPTRTLGSFSNLRLPSISVKSPGLIFEAQPAARTFSVSLGIFFSSSGNLTSNIIE
jgi:hypothetical protein